MFIIAVAAAALLVSCATVTTVPDIEIPAALGEEAGRLSRPGVGSYNVETGNRTGEFGRAVSYETYRPDQPQSDAMVFLAHGFKRNLSAMRGWAALWASHGVAVTVMSLPNSTWINGHHARNAADLLALARALHSGPVLYAGFSSGGLSACLAAAQDPRAIAYLGLDAVDSGRLARASSSAFSLPALLLIGEPSACNARNNMLEALPDIAVLKVINATHCAFENPYDLRCERVCGSVEPPEAAAAILDTIRCLATAWVLMQTGAEPGAGAVLVEARNGGSQWSRRVAIPPAR